MSEAHSITPDPVPGRLAIAMTVLVALAAITPYVREVPKENLQLVSNAQTNLFAGWLMMIAFYFKSRNDAVKDQTIAAQAQTAREAGAALAAVATPANVIPVAAGDSVTVKADDA